MGRPVTSLPELTTTLLAKGPYARGDAPFAALDLTGPDAGEFLQRLCSQDVQALGQGGVAPAAFLDAKGKVQATCLVTGGGERFVLEVPQEQLDRLAALLDRYHFSERLTMRARPPGPCRERIEPAVGDGVAAARSSESGLVVRFARRGVQFTRSHGEGVSLEGASVDGAPLDAARAECLRMAAGFVRVGVETEAATLALEADLDDHCSTTKGCYTGQEIVARIHTYGHVNRRLRLLRLPDGPSIDAPVQLVEPDDGVPVGRVMRAVPAPGLGFRVGLGYLPKDFQAVGTRLAFAEGGGEVVVAGW